MGPGGCWRPPEQRRWVSVCWRQGDGGGQSLWAGFLRDGASGCECGSPSMPASAGAPGGAGQGGGCSSLVSHLYSVGAWKFVSFSASHTDKATNPLNKDLDWDGINAFCEQLNKELEG